MHAPRVRRAPREEVVEVREPAAPGERQATLRCMA
jgi:hypothetical protein